MDLYKKIAIGVLPTLLLACLTYVIACIVTAVNGEANVKVAYGFIIAFALLAIFMAGSTTTLAFEEFALSWKNFTANILVVLSALLFIIGGSIMIYCSNNSLVSSPNALIAASVINIVAIFIAIPAGTMIGYSIAKD